MPFDFQPGQPDENDSLGRTLGALAVMALVGLCAIALILLLIV